VSGLLEALVRGLVREPERVRIVERREGAEVSLEISVARADRGRVIGRQGHTLEALRTLLEALARARGETCRLEVLE
jgi:predicted RNA-binding protein YlqC (UPF0109 family)